MNYRTPFLLLLILLLGLGAALGWMTTRFQLVPKPMLSQEDANSSGPGKAASAGTGGAAAMWRVSITMDTPDLVDVPGVQWTVFSEDPLPIVKQRLSQSDDANVVALKWDTLFKKVTGDEVSFLSSNPRNTSIFGSNGRAGQKWILTKAVWSQSKPYCWCLPFEATPQQTVKLQLNTNNAVNLQSLAGH